MKLRNKIDGHIYYVSTYSDEYDGFVIFARAELSYVTLDGTVGGKDFCMHYRSLAEFNDEWEDV